MSIKILIPAYQPDQKLIDLVNRLSLQYPVVVVDDGSGEAYRQVFADLIVTGAVILHHEYNHGKGTALKTGIRYLSKQSDTGGIITADADGQHTVEDIGRVAAAMRAHPDTLILGGRNFKQMPPRSRFGNSATCFFFRLLTGLKITDTQTGLRALPARLFPRLLALEGDRYEYEMNMLLSLREWGTEYLEIPIQTVYLENNQSSHYRVLRDSIRIFSRVLKYAMSSFVCTGVDYLLYILLLKFFGPAASYALARLCSATLNYQLNCRVVFRGKPTWKNALQYTLLAAASLAIGSASVSFLSSLGFNSVFAKLLIDGLLFIGNYLVQKHLIFRRVST